jgi:hypothetical protein
MPPWIPTKPIARQPFQRAEAAGAKDVGKIWKSAKNLEKELTDSRRCVTFSMIAG